MANIPDKSFQLVRYYGWYSNKMRGQRDKREAEKTQPDTGNAIQVIDVSEYRSRRIPSAKWRELIKKVWEADPLMCPRCSKEMRIVALIDDQAVIERILRHLGLWEQGVRVCPSTGPPACSLPSIGRAGRPAVQPAERTVEPWFGNPFPGYDTEPIMAYANE